MEGVVDKVRAREALRTSLQFQLEQLWGWGHHEWKAPGVGEAGVGRATNKLTLCLVASEQQGIYIQNITSTPQKAEEAAKVWPLPTSPGSSSTSLASASSTHAGLLSVPRTLNVFPPQGLCTCHSTYHRAWHIAGLKKYLVMNKKDKRREGRRKLLTSSFPKRIFQRPREVCCAITVTDTYIDNRLKLGTGFQSSQLFLTNSSDDLENLVHTIFPKPLFLAEEHCMPSK